MANLIRLGGSALCLVLVLSYASVAFCQAELCLNAIRKVALEGLVPEKVLLAIARIESGRGGNSPVPAWPWAVNHSGESHWFSTRQEAETYVIGSLRAGEENLDIGCLQINYRWHGSRFASVGQMFDPVENARYAAGFLSHLYAEEHDWSVAAGKYHSRTAILAEAYRSRFQTALAASHSSSGPTRVRSQNGFPLLVGGPAGVRGSTVPAVTGVGSLFFLQARRIIGD